MKKVLFLTLCLTSGLIYQGQAHTVITETRINQAKSVFQTLAPRHQSLLSILQNLPEIEYKQARDAVMESLSLKQLMALKPLPEALSRIKDCLSNDKSLTPADTQLINKILSTGILQTLTTEQSTITAKLPQSIKNAVEALILDIQARIGRL